MALCFPLCFFACKSDKQIQLSTPFTIGYVKNETDSGTQLLLVTDKNPNATKYEFFISDSVSDDKIYLSYIATENYLDVTNIFTDLKEYSYYVRYLGSGKYTTSKPSKIKVFAESNREVTTPSLQISGSTLNWFKIPYATSYEVYETVKNADNSVKTQETKIATLNNDTFSYDISSRLSSESPYYKYSYSIKALGSGFYTNSSNSNSVEYIQKIKLSTPQNLKVEKSSDKVMLSFNNVEYATKYLVTINDDDSKTFETTETTYDVTTYITNYASFYFKVQAVESEVIEYDESENTDNVEYKNILKLTVSNLTCSRNGESIEINFTGHELASNKYTLVIKHNNVEIYSDGSFSSGTNLLISSNLEIESGLITISVKANHVNDYILESDYISIDYTIE